MEGQLFSKRILAGLLIILTFVTLCNATCTYVDMSGATITTATPSTVQCTASEVDSADTTLCQFSTPGNTEISLLDYSGTKISDYMTLTSNYESVNDRTVISISTKSSLNDIADLTTSLTGGIVCGAVPNDVLVISITTVNDQIPTFSQSEYTFPSPVSETYPQGIDLLQQFKIVITANDTDTPFDPASTMDFSIIAGDNDGTFQFKTDPGCSGYCVGQLFVVGKIDYQSHPQYVLTLQAADEGNPSLTSTATLTIDIQDYDDLDPAFTDTFYYSEVTLIDDSAYPLVITPGPINAADQDTGINSPVSYQLLIDPSCGPACDAITSAFTIDPTTAVITFDSSVDLSVVNDRTITFGVKAVEADNAFRSAMALVIVTLPVPPTTTTQTTPTTTTITTTTPTTTTTTPTTTTTTPTTTTTTPTTTTAQTTTACPTLPPTTTVTTPTSTITTVTSETETTITTCSTMTYPTGATDTTLPPTGGTGTTLPHTGGTGTTLPQTGSTQTDVTGATCPDSSSTTVILTTTDCSTGSTVVTSSEFSSASPYTIATNTGSTVTITVSDSTTADPTATPVTSYTCSPTDITAGTTGITDPTAPTIDPTGSTANPTGTTTKFTGTTTKYTGTTTKFTGTTTKYTGTTTKYTGTTTLNTGSTTIPTGPTQDPTTFPTGMTCFPTVTDSLTTTTGTTTPHTTTPAVTCPPCPTSRPEPVGNTTQTTLISVLTPKSAKVMTVTDNTAGTHTYSIGGSPNFDIDPVSGDIYVNDYLIIGDYPLTVYAASDINPEVQDISQVNIRAIADQAVAVFPQNYFEVNANENEIDGTSIELIDLSCIYESTSTLASYTISDPNMEAIFSVDPNTGLVSVYKTLNYESNPVYDLIIDANMATNSEVTKQLKNNYMTIGGQGPTVDLKYNQALVRVFVQDKDDQPPVFVNECISGDKLTLAISAYTSAAQDAIQLQTTDNDTDPNNKIVYYFLDNSPSQFYVNQETGLLMASVPFTELESSLTKSYLVHVRAANDLTGELNKATLDITIYILQQGQILLMNSSYPVSKFDSDHESILSTLSTAVGQEIRGLKWVSNTDASTKAYLYALGSGVPLLQNELMDMVTTHQAAFQDNGFDTQTATTYDKAPDMVTIPADTTGLIIGISILGALLGICLIAGAILGWRAYQKKRKSKKFYRDMNDDFGRKSDDKPDFDTMESSTHQPARRPSEAFNTEMRSEEHKGFENQIINEEDNLEEVLHSDNHIYPDLDYKEDSSPTEIESKIHQFETVDNLHELGDFPGASTAMAEHIDSPSPDYYSMGHKGELDDDEPAKSILVDSSIATSDTLEELQMKEDLMVTFNEVPEVIAVAAHEAQENIHQREDNDDDLGGLQ